MAVTDGGVYSVYLLTVILRIREAIHHPCMFMKSLQMSLYPLNDAFSNS